MNRADRIRSSRQQVKEALDRFGLLPTAYAVRQAWRSARPDIVRSNLTMLRPEPGQPPWPPLRLIYAVTGHMSRSAFRTMGYDNYEDIRDAFRAAGRDPLAEGSTVLDFGCGCGRILRHWKGTSATVFGTDPDQRVVDWCRENLRFVDMTCNQSVPPLPYDDASFDFIYAFSVFTHLPVASQKAWMEELTRVLRPEGLLTITTHGQAATSKFDSRMLGHLHDRGVLVLHEGHPGANVCAAYHSEAYLREVMAPGLEMVLFKPSGLRWSVQDLSVYRRP